MLGDCIIADGLRIRTGRTGMVIVAFDRFGASALRHYRLPMTIALDVIGLRKEFTAGVARCSATVSVLRGLDLTVRSGESMSIVGEPASGRSTLLLCLAGLLGPDQGIIRWFGDDERQAALVRTRYHLSCEELWDTKDGSVPMIHLLDLGDLPSIPLEQLGEWIAARTRSAGVVLLSATSLDIARQLTATVMMLRDGRLVPLKNARSRARVAEGRFVDHPFDRV